MITAETICKTALGYAARGWLVFPVWWIMGKRCACGGISGCKPGKHPLGKLVPHGLKEATTDVETIKRWWEKFPRANIGILTGPESGLVVVDVDPRHGGHESWKRMERLGQLPYTPMAHTGGDGDHILLQHPGAGRKIKSRSLPGYPGIDIKADGGCIVAAPSNHVSGGQYSWKIGPDTPLATPPEWLMSLLLQDDVSQLQSAKRVEGEIPDGQWSVILTSLAGTMRRRGMGQEAIEAALLVENKRCAPPLPEAEVNSIAMSISRYDPAPTPVVAVTAPEKTYLPSPPPFPVDIFPAGCQRAIEEIQKAHGVSVEIPGCAILGTAGGCIGRARGLCIKQGWIEHANLWLAVVDKSGSGKSPAVREIQRPIFALEKRWFANYQEAQRQYNLELEQRRLTPKDERSILLPPPATPGWRQLIVDDATTESLTDVFAANPRGILWNRDELAGLLNDLDKYSKKEGGSKARMMSAYDSGPWKVNRREASKRAFIPHATLSIFGTIQPKILPTIFSDLDAATGFLPRFIFVRPIRENPSLWTDETVSHMTRDYLASIFTKLLALDFDGQGDPVIIGVDQRAKRLYESWFNEQVLEPWQNAEAAIYEAVLAKLRGQCLRIALILYCLEAVDVGRLSDTPPVSAETMEKAITLADCFKAHQRNAWRSIVYQDKVTELSPLPLQVARAIHSLEKEIKGGMLATARITEKVNQGLDPKFHVTADTVGRTAAALKLTTDKLPDRSGRGFRIKPEDLQRLGSSSTFKTCVPSVLSDQSSASMRRSEGKSSVPEASQVTGGDGVSGHLGHLPDTCEMPGKCHEDNTSDTSGASSHILVGDTPRLAAWDRAMGLVMEGALKALPPDKDQDIKVVVL